MKIEAVIEELSRRNKNVEFLSSDTRGRVSAIVNNELTIYLESSRTDEGFFLYSGIIKVPNDKEHPLSVMALEGNLFHNETGKASIGYHRASGWLILFQHFTTSEMVYSIFEEQFDRFIEHVLYWKNKTEKCLSEISDTSFEDHVMGFTSAQDLKIFFA